MTTETLEQIIAKLRAKDRNSSEKDLLLAGVKIPYDEIGWYADQIESNIDLYVEYDDIEEVLESIQETFNEVDYFY